MAKYRSIQTSFWSDSKIIDDFTAEDRYFYLYLLTNEKSNQIGCYELSIKKICRDTGLDEKKVKNLIDKFQNELKVIYYDHETKEIFLKNWYKYNWLESDKIKICIEHEFDGIKSAILKEYIYPLYTPYIPYASNKKKKKKKKNNKKNNNSGENFTTNDELVATATTPTLNSIIEYGASLNVDASYCEKFYNHYESIGWVNGSGQQIKNWKLIFKNWIAKDGKSVKQESKKIDELKKVDDGVFIL